MARSVSASAKGVVRRVRGLLQSEGVAQPEFRVGSDGKQSRANRKPEPEPVAVDSVPTAVNTTCAEPIPVTDTSNVEPDVFVPSPIEDEAGVTIAGRAETFIVLQPLKKLHFVCMVNALRRVRQPLTPAGVPHPPVARLRP